MEARPQRAGRPWSIQDALAILLVSSALFLLLSSLCARLGAAGSVLVEVLSFAAPALLLARARDGGFSKLGFRRCVGTVLVATAVIALSLWIWNVLWIAPIGRHWSSPEQEQALTTLFATQSRPLWESVILFAAVPAFCEELLHRGVITPALRSWLGWSAAVLLSGLIFGLSHLSLSRLLPTTLLGLIAAALRLQTDSLAPPMLLHFLYNTSLLLAAQQAWTLTPSAALPAALVSLAGAIGIRRGHRKISQARK